MYIDFIKVIRYHISTDIRIIFQMPSSKLLDLNYSPTGFCKKKKKKKSKIKIKKNFLVQTILHCRLLRGNVCEGLSALNPSFIQQIFTEHLLEVRNSVMNK